MKLFLPDGEVRRCFWEPLASEPAGIFEKCGSGLPIRVFELRHQPFVFHAGERFNQVLSKEIGEAAGDLNCQLYMRSGKNRRQIGFRGDNDVRDLRFNHYHTASAVLERSEIAFDVNVQIGCARINHRVPLENGQVLALKQFIANRRLQDAKIDGLARAQSVEIELAQAIVESAKPGYFGVECQPAEVSDLPVVLVESERGAEERPGSEVSSDVFFGNGLVFFVRRFDRRVGQDRNKQSQDQRKEAKIIHLCAGAESKTPTLIDPLLVAKNFP